MNKVTLKNVASLLLGATFGASTLPVLGDVVYENTSNKLNQVYAPGGQIEFGDEIKLGGTMRTLNTFTFEYFLNNASGNEFIRLRLYNNDGTPAPGVGAPSPGSLIYDFGFEHIDPTPLNDGLTLKFTFPANIVAPEDFTWTVSFLGIADGETAGLELYNGITTGNGYDDFWEKNPNTGAWELKSGPVPMNFGALVEAVPEPAPLMIGLLAGMLMLGVRTYRRKLARA